MATFGELLKQHRLGCRDPLNNRPLSQERLGELIGHEIGGAGYSAVAVSNWERDRSSIHANDRLVLVGIVSILTQYGSLDSAVEADQLLHAGNYRGLDDDERTAIFGDRPVPPIETPAPAARAAQPVTLDRRRELILLNKVRRFWIEGVLEESLAKSTAIELRGKFNLDAVVNVWGELVQQTPNHASHALDDDTLADLFASSGASLLVLGGPGAGKTFTLLRLARKLLRLAEADPLRSIPVVLNLSSWAEREGQIGDWVLEELTAKYQIPAQFGRTWLENDRLILLLDGLDVVPGRARDRCIAALNQFRKEFGFTGIAVCCRSSKYFESDSRLMMESAIEINHLDAAQVNHYLGEAGLTDDTMGRELGQAQSLELIQSPLVLRVLASMKVDDVDALPVPRSVNGIQDEDAYLTALIHGYVEQMLARSDLSGDFQPEQIKRWLAWLAGRMADHHQSELFVELMQPSWLPSPGLRRLYILLTRFLDGILIGVTSWLLLLQLRFIHPDLPLGATRALFFAPTVPQETREFFWLVGTNVILGVLVGILQIFLYEKNPLRNWGRLSPHQLQLGQVFIIGLFVALATFSVGVWIGDPLLIAFWSVVQAIVHMLFARFIHGSDYRTEFRSMNAISWSWRGMSIGIAAGTSLAFFAELIERGYDIDNGLWPTLLAYGLAGVLVGGLSGQRIYQEARPNQGIRQSAINAGLATAVALPTLGLMGFILWGPECLPVTIALILLTAGSYFGGGKVDNHVVLRLILWSRGAIPRDLVGFLNQAAALSLLRKVGGGFIFAHELIQDHFRNLETA